MDMKGLVIYWLLEWVGQKAPPTLRPTWRSGVRSGMHVASQLTSGEGAGALIWMILWHLSDNQKLDDEDVYLYCENTAEMIRN